MPTVTLKLTSGEITDITCEKVVSIDGKPFQPVELVEEILSRLQYLEGQIDLMKTAMFVPQEDDEG